MWEGGIFVRLIRELRRGGYITIGVGMRLLIESTGELLGGFRLRVRGGMVADVQRNGIAIAVTGKIVSGLLVVDNVGQVRVTYVMWFVQNRIVVVVEIEIVMIIVVEIV